MLFNFEEFFVKREDLCWAFGSRGRETTFGVGQDLFQMSRHSHRELGLRLNLKLEIQNPKSARSQRC